MPLILLLSPLFPNTHHRSKKTKTILENRETRPEREWGWQRPPRVLEAKLGLECRSYSAQPFSFCSSSSAFTLIPETNPENSGRTKGLILLICPHHHHHHHHLFPGILGAAPLTGRHHLSSLATWWGPEREAEAGWQRWNFTRLLCNASLPIPFSQRVEGTWEIDEKIVFQQQRLL